MVLLMCLLQYFFGVFGDELSDIKIDVPIVGQCNFFNFLGSWD